MHTTLRCSAVRLQRSRAVVDRAEAYVRAHPGHAVRVSTLCRVIGLSERGLRDAFYSVRGMSPHRRLLRVRLDAVRRSLRDAHDGGATVTDVAMRFGFFELGRFAATYRSAFGERPSDTLRVGRRAAP